MPRRSAASLSVVDLDTSQARVKPYADLPEPVRDLWNELVGSLPGSRFHASDRPLLSLYVRALHLSNLAFAEIEEKGAYVHGETNPFIKIADTACKQVAVLSTRLRLCPQSRLDRKVAGPAARDDHSGAKPWGRSDE